MLFGIGLLAILGLWWAWENAHRKTHPVPPGLQKDIDLPYEQEFELYHNALSLCSMKTRVCMAELQLPYKSHPIDLIETGSYENISRRFLKVNPGGTVPVLVHNGHPVYESHEQIRYAADHAPPGSRSLVPDDQALQKEMQHWVDLSSLTEDPINNGEKSAGNAVPALTVPIFATMIEKIPVLKILEGFFFHFDKKRPSIFLLLKLRSIESLPAPVIKLLDRGHRQMSKHLDDFEAQLEKSGGPWILGDVFSLADVSWLVIFERLAQVDYEKVYLWSGESGSGKRPQTTAYWARLKSRPSYAEAIEGHSHPTIVYGTRRLIEAKAANPELREALEGAAQ